MSDETWYKLEAIPTPTVEEFARDQGLLMVVRERPQPVGSPMRFYACFDRAEVVGDGVLIGTFGNGATAEEAIADYTREIALRTLVVDAYGEKRREINVPRLSTSTGGDADNGR